MDRNRNGYSADRKSVSPSIGIAASRGMGTVSSRARPVSRRRSGVAPPSLFRRASAEQQPMARDSSARSQQVLLVTGMLGAGKTTALHELEDLGWEVIDNFPIRMLDRLVRSEERRVGKEWRSE